MSNKNSNLPLQGESVTELNTSHLPYRWVVLPLFPKNRGYESPFLSFVLLEIEKKNNNKKNKQGDIGTHTCHRLHIQVLKITDYKLHRYK